VHVVRNALNRNDWLVGNFGPRCTLVSSASALLLLGARSDPRTLVHSIERRVNFRESRLGMDWLAGPWLLDYPELPLRRAPLDLSIEAAAMEAGIEVESHGRLFWRWATLLDHLHTDSPIVLNCLKAPGSTYSHSVVCVGGDERQLLAVDPNDGQVHVKERGKPSSGLITSVTLSSSGGKPFRCSVLSRAPDGRVAATALRRGTLRRRAGWQACESPSCRLLRCPPYGRQRRRR
jgi:hypothetical protein